MRNSSPFDATPGARDQSSAAPLQKISRVIKKKYGPALGARPRWTPQLKRPSVVHLAFLGRRSKENRASPRPARPPAKRGGTAQRDSPDVGTSASLHAPGHLPFARLPPTYPGASDGTPNVAHFLQATLESSRKTGEQLSSTTRPDADAAPISKRLQHERP